MCKYLYHYTRLETLEKIFNDEKGETIELWLKDCHFLNDEDEGKWLVRFMNECKDGIVAKFGENERYACERAIQDFVESGCYRMSLKEQDDEHYCFSMSELEDSMLFWRQDYAKNNGVALCTEKKEFEKKCGWEIEPVCYLDVNTVKDILPSFVEAIKEDAKYVRDREDSRKIDPDTLEGERSLENVEFLKIKNGTWQQEKEWRIIVTKRGNFLNMCTNKNGESESAENSNFIIDKNFIPRYKLKMDNPFSRIILGPSLSNYYVDSVQKWFDQKGYKIKVCKSLGHER